MAGQTPFFGKREPEPFQPRQAAMPTTMPGVPAQNTPASALGATSSPAAGGAPDNAASKLTVGPNIKLKGVEITDCDTLVVEGTVEATVDSRLMQISQEGAFRGAAEIDIAEIRGIFDGTLTVRQKLVIFATGKVSGKIRYGKLVVEEGGRLSGEIEVDGGGPTKPEDDAAAKRATGSTPAAAAATPAR